MYLCVYVYTHTAEQKEEHKEPQKPQDLKQITFEWVKKSTFI